MKTIKIFLSVIFVSMTIAVQAQSVWIYKSDGTRIAYDASLVKSVEFAKFCSVENVVLLEDYNIDEGKHTFAESLIASAGARIPNTSTVQYGVVNTLDKTQVPTKWVNQSDAVANASGVWQVWAKVSPSTSDKGYKEDVIRIGETAIRQTDLGWYAWIDNETAYSLGETVDGALFTTRVPATKYIYAPEGGKFFMLALPEGIKPTGTTNGGNFGFSNAADWEVKNPVNINGKLYNFWISGNPSSEYNDITIVLNNQ